MAEIALSIKPRYLNAILSGNKKYEFRKICPQKPIERIYFHLNGEDAQFVQAYADVTTTHCHTPDAIWKKCGSEGGVTKDDFFYYYAGRKGAVAFELENPVFLSTPIPLEKLGIKKITQGFAYVDESELT